MARIITSSPSPIQGRPILRAPSYLSVMTYSPLCVVHGMIVASPLPSNSPLSGLAMHKRQGLLPIVAVLLFSVSSVRGQAAPTVPQIVAKGKFLNQTAAITKTILIPTQAGLYRLSAYATITVADPNSQSEWIYVNNWTDDSGVLNSWTPLYGPGRSAGGFGDFIGTGGASILIEVKAGTPIAVTVTQSGPADQSAYSLYYTLERLE
jgi:hypothetical protein